MRNLKKLNIETKLHDLKDQLTKDRKELIRVDQITKDQNQTTDQVTTKHRPTTDQVTNLQGQHINREQITVGQEEFLQVQEVILV